MSTNKKRTQIQGNVNKLTQIEKVEGDVIIQTSEQESSSDLLIKAITLIRTRSYDQAISVLESALQIDPTIPELHYYLAIALLHGKRPKLVKLSTIRKIEEHLDISIKLCREFGGAYVLWALIKYDFYILNGMFDRPPTYQDLLEEDWLLEQTHTEEILTYIKAEENQVWKWLHKQ